MSDNNMNGVDGVVVTINYEETKEMRLDLAISKIQQYKAISDIDDDAAELVGEWQVYYKKLKKETDLVLAYNLAIPEATNQNPLPQNEVVELEPFTPPVIPVFVEPVPEVIVPQPVIPEVIIDVPPVDGDNQYEPNEDDTDPAVVDEREVQE